MFISHFKSLSGKARHQELLTQGQLHNRNGKMAATKITRSAGDAARLCARYHLPSSRDGAECHHDLQKRLTRRRQQQADDAHAALIKLRGFGLSAGHFTHTLYAELFSETENDALSAIKSSLFLVIGIMLFGSDIYSLLPLYNTMAILIITYAILFLPYTTEYITSA
jgi:hypothetical protein